ncbi:MAG TPA: exonuclease domain-containing protein [Burkholderiales bacterium]|nr:exonuclease domain-containing protein [Burkholderiales bacterium]
MRSRAKFALWLAAFYAGVLAVIGAFGLAVWVGAEGPSREVLARVLEEQAPGLVYAAAILAFVCAGVLRWLAGRYPVAVRQLAEQTNVVLGANPDYRVAAAGGAEMAELAGAINRLAEAYRRAERDLDAKSAEARARVEEERNRLAALMSELSEGVLVCNAQGRILLYNERALALLGGGERGGRERHVPLGLGRSVFALLDRDQVAHALDKIQHQLDRGVDRPATRFVTGATHGTLLQVQVAPFLSTERAVAGMVFALDDVSGLVGREGQRLALLHALATGVRAPVANIRAAGESLAAFPDMEPERRAQFVQIIAAESRGLTDKLNVALRDYADALKASLTLEDMRIVDLVSVARRRVEEAVGIPTASDEEPEEVWVRVDSFAFVQGVAYLAAQLRDEYGVRGIRFRARASGGFAELDLVWTGAIVARDALALWETQPMRIGADETPLTLKDVLERHGGEVWSLANKTSHSAWFRFLLPLGEPVAAPAVRPAAVGSRPEYYDFDLFERIDTAADLVERRLAELSYTVFDTETTGLEPSAGDEIISLGAVRIVNGRLLKQEVFEQLVNPQRPIDRAAMRVHGIDERALAGQPTIGAVLPAFHRFCEDTVLVAHNAAFDMRFLELKEAATGIRFAQPVLDTLLLSAALHPNLENHSLDAIAERVGVPVIGRHTALGDALVTGEVFLKLLPLLAERGILTLKQALEVSRDTYAARLQY